MKTKKLLPQEGTMLPNEACIPKPTIPFPVLMAEKPEVPKRFWLVRFGIWIGALMVRPNEPKGWGWNPSVITLCIVCGGILFTAGMYIGHQNAKVEFLEMQSEATQRIATSAKNESSYAIAKVDGGDGHAPKNTNTKEKK